METPVRFTGDVKNDEEIHGFITEFLPQYPSKVHKQITAFVQGKDSALTPDFDALCEESPQVREVIEALVVASLQEVRKTMQGLEQEFRHVDDQVYGFLSCVASDLFDSQKILVTRYIHAKTLNMEIPPSEERALCTLCAQRPDVRDVIHYFAGTLDAETFMERHGERLWQNKWGTEE